MPVRVTKVTVEYEAGGKTFSVILDPTKVDAILLDRTDLDRLQFAHREARKKDTTLPEVIEHRLNALEQIPANDPKSGRSTFIMSPTSAPAGTVSAQRSLWWHTIECAYFHPDAD